MALMNIATVPIISGPYKTFRPLNAGETFIEYEGSTITIPLTTKRLDKNKNVISSKTEDIQLMAFMRLEVMPPYINGLGTREFQFIIRDWDLFGTNALLNEFFSEDERGELVLPRPRPRQHLNMLMNRRRRQVWMTFNVANHFAKQGDDDNLNFATTDLLQIDNITSHDLHQQRIYWQLQSRDGEFEVIFHNKPPEKGEVATIELSEKTSDADFLLGRAVVGRDGRFVATISEDEYSQENTAFSTGNTRVSKGLKLRSPVSISWQIGRKPQAGAKGWIRMVSPPKSICTAYQRPVAEFPNDAADFPARIMYAASYNIYLNNAQFVMDQSGVALCDGVHEIPPRDVTVAFDKPHSGTVLDELHHLEFGPGCCTGMHEISEEEYRRGVEFARWCRTLPLTAI